MSKSKSPGKLRFAAMQKALRGCRARPTAWSTVRSVIWGVTGNGLCVAGQTIDGFLNEAGTILLKSGRAYRYGDTVVLEGGPPGNRTLRLLASEGIAQTGAAGLLANLFVVGVRTDTDESQCAAPSSLVKALLASEQAMGQLPEIRLHFTRPVFDDNFHLVGPGWHAGSGILVHGPDITPVMPAPAPSTSSSARALDLLPPCTRGLLEGFCFASDADLANAVGALLTGLLANHFIDAPKPVFITDANQRGVGKTTLWQAYGCVLDGSPPKPLKLSGEEELEKKLSAILRTPVSSIILFDNQRGPIDSTVLEAGAPSPVLSYRILGQSAMVARPNTYLWAITSNQTSGTEDLISRGIPIRMRFEGDPRHRAFSTEDLLAYARSRRVEILGELAGLVLHWNQQGRPNGSQMHRCGVWAKTIGGILGCIGLTQFLDNLSEAEAEMDEGLQTLATLAEHVQTKKLSGFIGDSGSSAAGKLPKAWVPLFAEQDLCRNQLAGKSQKSQETFVGKFLSGKTGRCVDVSLPTRLGKATLNKIDARGGQKLYYFALAQAEDAAVGPAAPASGGAAAATSAGTAPRVAAQGAAQVAAATSVAAPGAPTTTTHPTATNPTTTQTTVPDGAAALQQVEGDVGAKSSDQANPVRIGAAEGNDLQWL